jgi:hypothetical protein
MERSDAARVPCRPAKSAHVRSGRRACRVVASAVATKTVKIGTRGSPLALAQAYMTRDLLKVRPEPRSPPLPRNPLPADPSASCTG